MQRLTTYFLSFTLFIFVSTWASAQDTTQNNLLRANQLLKELLPDKKLAVSKSGIRESESFILEIDFDVNKQLELAVITIDENALTFELCCVLTMKENPDGTITDYYSTTIYPLTSSQLPLAKELKTLIENIMSDE